MKWHFANMQKRLSSKQFYQCSPSKMQTYQNCFQISHLRDTEVIDNIFYLLVWAKRMQGGGRKSKTKGGIDPQSMVQWKQSCFYETHNQVLFQVDQCLGTSVPSRSKTLQGFKLGGMEEKSVWANLFFSYLVPWYLIAFTSLIASISSISGLSTRN